MRRKILILCASIAIFSCVSVSALPEHEKQTFPSKNVLVSNKPLAKETASDDKSHKLKMLSVAKPSNAPNVSSSTTPSHNNTTTHQQVILDSSKLQRLNSGALLRGFYVFVGLSVIVVMYLVVRSVRVRRNVSTRVHKYGILADREDVEMTPLGVEDDEEDTIVFDLSNHPPS